MDSRSEVIENLFTFHKATPEQIESYNAIRDAAKILAYVIDQNCAPGPDRTTAIRKVTGNAQYRCP